MASHADPAKKREYEKRERVQSEYILLVIFALCVVTLALVFSISFTQGKLGTLTKEEPAIKTIIEELTLKPETALDPEALSQMNFWPEDVFPSVPQFPASQYVTSVDNLRAVIEIPAADAEKLTQYVSDLSESGAAVHVRAETIIVLMQAGTEIQIKPTGARPTITLCGEPQISFQSTEYPELLLPQGGRLIGIKEGVGAGSLHFTYRNASIHDVMAYINDLSENDWQPTTKLNFKNNTLLAQYKKRDMNLTVDYYAGGDNYVIRLEIEASPDVEE